MYLLARFILQSFRKILRADPDLWGCEQNFFGANHYYYFRLPIGHFYSAKFKKILIADPELWGCAIFGPKMVHFPQTKNFFLKIINISLIYLLAPFIVQNYKKNSSRRSRVTRMCNFWTQNGPFSQMRIFSENLLMSLVFFIPAYLHAKNQSQILIY